MKSKNVGKLIKARAFVLKLWPSVRGKIGEVVD